MSNELIQKLAIENGAVCYNYDENSETYSSYEFEPKDLMCFAKAYHQHQSKDALEYIAKLEGGIELLLEILNGINLEGVILPIRHVLLEDRKNVLQQAILSKPASLKDTK